jgi:hypothetical protein
MPRRVVNFYAYWWTAGNTRSVVVWKMAPSCLLWCLWKEMNDRSFEDRKKTLEEIKLYFSTHCIFRQLLFVFPFVISYHYFLVLFALTMWLVLYTSCIPGSVLCFYWYFDYLLKKKWILIIEVQSQAFSLLFFLVFWRNNGIFRSLISLYAETNNLVFFSIKIKNKDASPPRFLLQHSHTKAYWEFWGQRCQCHIF